MKRITELFLSLIMALTTVFGSVPLGIFAYTENPATDFEYTITDSEVTIDDYIGSATEVVIPAEIEGCPVTSIGDNTFYNCTSLTSITIPDSVTSIGNRAFDGCSALTSITIPEGVTSIGEAAFYYCESLTSITVSEDNTKYSSKDGVLFDKDKTTIMCCPAGKSGEYIVPNSVTSIGDSAFEGCSALTSITIPEGVTSIGVYAFYYCSSLTSISIPDSVTSIGDAAFYLCKSLTSISIPDSVTSIGDYAFYRCYSFTSVTIPDSVTSIGGDAFSRCESLTSIEVSENNKSYSSEDGVLFNKEKTELICYPGGKTGQYVIPDSITRIGYSAFLDCHLLLKITIPDSVTNIVSCGHPVDGSNAAAFNGCKSLTSIEVSENNKNYSSEDGVLFNKEKTELICYPGGKTGQYVIPDSVKSIGASAFENCDSLTSITIPDSVTSIGYYAFKSCDSLTSVIVGDGITRISDFAFLYCDSLTSVIIGKSLTSIGEDVFRGCSSLTSIEVSENNDTYSSSDGVLFNKDKTALIRSPGGKKGSYVIPDSVTEIAMHAFYGCSSLTSISIPDSVTSIGEGAFRDCSSLTSIAIPNSVTSIGDWAFANCSTLTSIEVSENNKTYSSEEGVLFNKEKTELICCPGGKKGLYVIPEGVTSIGNHAFRDCRALTSITIPDSVSSIGYFAFAGCDSLTDVYYTGTESEWNAIEIESCNDSLLRATIHFNYVPGALPEEITPSEGSDVVVDAENAIVSGIAAQSKPADVIAQFEGSDNIQIVGKDGKVLADDALVGTGCKVQLIENGEIKDEVTVVIKGEIDGNGKIDSDDAIYILRNTLFASLYPVVVEDDVDGNGKYDSDDAIYLLRHTLFPSMYPLK